MEPKAGVGAKGWGWSQRLELEPKAGVGAKGWGWSQRLELEPKAGVEAKGWGWSQGLGDVIGPYSSVGITAEGWLKLWDTGFSHDHGQFVDDDTHQTSCREESHCHSGSRDHDGSHDHGSHQHAHGNKVDVHLKRNLHHLTGGDTGKSILVSLCGNSPDMKWLCDQGYSVAGVEISETAVKQVFEKALDGPIPFEVITDGSVKIYSATDDKKLKVFVGNIFDDGISPAKVGTFDCIWDAHGIVSLPVAQQKQYAEKLCTFLKPGGGKILFSTVDYDITKLKEEHKEHAPPPVPASLLQEFYPGRETVLLENGPSPHGKLKGVTNPVVLVTIE